MQSVSRVRKQLMHKDYTVILMQLKLLSAKLQKALCLKSPHMTEVFPVLPSLGG